MNIEDLMLLSVCGEGYYSGNSESYSMVISREFYDKYADEIHKYTPTFYELDGKHSEVEGEVLVVGVEEKELKYVISTRLEDESWKIEESMFESIGASREEIDTQISIDASFKALCDIKVVTSIYFKGERI